MLFAKRLFLKPVRFYEYEVKLLSIAGINGQYINADSHHLLNIEHLNQSQLRMNLHHFVDL